MYEMKMLDKSIIDELHSVLGSDLQALFQQQIDQANLYIEDIRTHMAKGEMAVVSRHAHSLKSSAGQVGLIGVQSLAKDLENASQAAPQDGVPNPRAMEAFARLVREHDMAVKALLEYISHLSGRA